MAALLLAAIALASAVPAKVRPVSAKTACTVVKARAAARDHFPGSRITFCDIIAAGDSPRGYYVLALHSRRHCEGICSTNMGWFAVQRSSGRVFDWDVAEDELGPEVRTRP